MSLINLSVKFTFELNILKKINQKAETLASNTTTYYVLTTTAVFLASQSGKNHYFFLLTASFSLVTEK